MKKLGAVLLLALLSLVSSRAQTSPYFNALTNLNPFGYWPMHEVEAPAPGDTETNYGSLGALANGYYSDWASGAPAGILRSQTGALANDSDKATEFLASNSGSYTNTLSIPHTSPLTTLTPPFTVEFWWNQVSGSGNDLWSQMGLEGLNANGTYGSQNGVINGTRMFANTQTAFYLYVYKHTATQTQVGNTTVALGWNHVAVTCDAQTNFSVYIDGVLKIGPKAEAANYEPDYWSPITLSKGRGYTRNGGGYGMMDEFAIYTNVISDISTHYTDGAMGPAGQYATDVLNDHPVVYLRMDNSAYTAPPVGTWPVLTNFGSVAVNGVYTPGTSPGAIIGPANSSGQPYQGLSGAMVAPLSGVSTFADAGNAAAYNPVGATPFSVSAMFRGNPCDPRIQTIAGHSTNSWGLWVNLNGQLVWQIGTNASLTSQGVYNDAQWHQVVAVYAPNPNHTLPGTNFLYVDGLLETQAGGVSTNGFGPGSPLDVTIGADPQYTNTPAALGQQFAGQVCEVALFTNALTATQAKALEDASEAPPSIKTQPQSASIGVGANYTNAMVAVGSSPLAYQWFTNGVALTGETNAGLVLNPATTNNSSADYYVVVTNNYGAATSTVVNITVIPSPVILAQFPITYVSPFSLYTGANPVFSVQAVGAPPLAYYWFTNNALDGAASGAALTLTNISTGSLNAFCIVSNSYGTATSTVWSATVSPIPTDGNGGMATYPQAVLALNPLGYWRLNEAESGGGDGGVVTLDYAGGNNGIYTNVNLGSSGYNPTWDPSDSSAQVGTFKTANSFAGQIGTNVDFGTPSGSNAEFSVQVWMQPNGNPPYVIYANNFPGGGIVAKGYYSSEEFALDNNSPNVTNGFRFFVRDASGAAHIANSSVSAVQGEWYHLVGVCDEVNSNVLLYINGSVVASAGIQPGSGILASGPVNMTIGSKGVNEVIGYPLQTKAYLNDVAVFNYALSSNQVLNEYIQSSIAPYFVQEPPNSVNVATGSNITVSASVFGSPSLSYQWYETNLVAMTGFPIPGQTSNTLVINNAQTNDSYFLNITNLYGSTNSVVVSVGVYTGPLFTSQSPQPYTNQFTLFAGTSPTFSVQAVNLQSNLSSVFYQWYVNGTAVPGATSVNFTLANLQAGSFPNCYCVASNTLGGTTSMIWSASVIAAPTDPYPQAVLSLRPLGFWRLDEPDNGSGNAGVIAHDYVEGNDGIYTNTTLGNSGYNPSTDPSAASAEFGILSLADCDAYGIGGVDFHAPATTSAAFSVEAWVSAFTQTKDAGIVSKGYSGAEQFDLDTGSDGGTPSHAFRFFVRDASGATHLANSSIVPDGNWHHLVGVCDEPNGSVSLYVDGALAATTSIATGGGILSSARSMLIGSRPSSQTSANDDQYVGQVDDVAVFNYALTATQITNEFQGIAAAPSINPNPTNIVFSLSGGQLKLSWPSDHTGWQLQSNSVGLTATSAWFTISGSTATNQMIVTPDSTRTNVFFRMLYQP